MVILSNLAFLDILKSTIIVNGRLALNSERYASAIKNLDAVQVMSVEHVAARLAGGMLQMIDMLTLRQVVSEVLPDLDLGELNEISDLPGFAKAASASLMKFWMSDINPQDYAANPRMKSIFALEAAVLDRMPNHFKRPVDLRNLAVSRAHLAGRIFGRITIRGMTDLHPVWRPLVEAVASHGKPHALMVWDAGPRDVPAWVKSNPMIEKKTSVACAPSISAITCANERHEVVEAFRWIRKLMVEGVDGADIAVATTNTHLYDDIFTAAAAEVEIDIHIAHGVSSIHRPEGQKCAALADIVLRGLSQKKVRRLISLCRDDSSALETLPDDWHRFLNPEAALTTVDRWERALSKVGQDAVDTKSVVIPFLKGLTRDHEFALEIGRDVLDDKAFLVWERALKNGPVLALDQTIAATKIEDGKNALFLPVFMNAENLACSPRRYVLLIGLTSRSWPRHDGEDPLIPDHVIPDDKLNPISRHFLDELDFQTISETTERELTLCWPRRDKDGRRCEPSSLITSQVIGFAKELGRSRIAEVAISEGDRLFSRPTEFALVPEAVKASQVIRNWYSHRLTAHDGVISANHPRIVQTLKLLQSATSLKKMLRDPIGFVWQYALGFRPADHEDEPLTVDARQFGNILHAILESVIEMTEPRGGWMKVSLNELKTFIHIARSNVARQMETDQQVPPDLIWRNTLSKAEELAFKALTHPFEPLPNQRTFGEVPFGNERNNLQGEQEIFIDCKVQIPGTDIFVYGYMDRLEISGDGKMARVADYKSGKTPKDLMSIRLDGGNEVQRPIYLYAAKTLLPEVETVEAGLLYPMTGEYAPVENPETVMGDLAHYVKSASDYLLAGFAIPGIGSGDTFNPHQFALPSNANATYMDKTLTAAETHVPELFKLWSEQ